jgi:hypothetical protein
VWITSRPADWKPLKIFISGETYMALAVTPLMSDLEYVLDEAERTSQTAIEVGRTSARRQKDTPGQTDPAAVLREETARLRRIRLARFALRRFLARPLYRAAGLPLPTADAELMQASKRLLPTLRPIGELAPYIGDALIKLRQGVDVFLNVGPTGCMVSSMGDVLTPSITQAAGETPGRIQNLFSADGDVNEELLTLAVLKAKAMGPERYYTSQRPSSRSEVEDR